MKVRMGLAAACGAAALVAAGCGSTSSGTGASGSTSGGASGGGSVAMVLPGPINDKGFNQSAYEGLQECKSAGMKTAYAEDVQTPDFTDTYERFARGNDVVIGPGFEFADVAKQVAPKFPDVKFVVTSNPLKPDQPNVLHTMINSVQGAYLAGAVAGLATKTNKLGGIAGLKFPVLEAQMKAFEAGAKHVNPKATMKVVYLGGFNDVGKGKEAAQSLAASGVDVVYHIADAAGVGVINGAQAAGIKAIGWGLDQNSIAPDTLIASQLVNQKDEIGDICKSIVNGRFKGGLKVEGLRSGLIGISKVYNEPPSVQQKVDQLKKQIMDGKVDVPPISPGVPSSGPQGG